MNDEQLNKLFRAVGQSRTDTSRVEYGFETRLMARLRAERSQPVPWVMASWRLIPVFAAVVVALGVWNLTGNGATDPSSTYSEQNADAAVASYLTGD